MMKRYCGNQKPYVYAVFPEGSDPRVESALNALDEAGTALWWNERVFDRKEAVRLKKAGAVLLFLTKELARTGSFRDAVTEAVRHEKDILTVYLEEVPLDACLTMQLGSAQALFHPRFESEEAYLKAVTTTPAFNGMHVTKEQKLNQRFRGWMAVLVPVAAALLIFLTVVVPMMVAHAREDALLKQFGLYGLSEEELLAITELNIVGDRIVNEYVHGWYVDGDTATFEYDLFNPETELMECQTTNGRVPHGQISDLSVLTRLKNLETLRLIGQNITDITPLFELKKLKFLGLCCNPVDSIAGIDALEELDSLDITSTNVRDLTPLRNCRNLVFFQEDCCDLESLDGLQGLPNLKCIQVNGTKVRSVPVPVQKEDYEFFFNNSFGDSLPESYAFLESVQSISHLTLQHVRIDELMTYLRGKRIAVLDINGSNELTSIRQLEGIRLYDQSELLLAWCGLESLDGIEGLEGLRSVSLAHNKHIGDLTPLLRCPDLEHVTLCSGLREKAEAELQGASFRIHYQDDNEDWCREME